MQNGSGKKTIETRGGGGRGSDGEGVPRLQEEDVSGDGVSISWENPDEHGRRLASGGWESVEGAGDMGEAGEDTGTGGGGPEGVTKFLYCRDTAGPPLWGGDMGSDRKYGGSSSGSHASDLV